VLGLEPVLGLELEPVLGLGPALEPVLELEPEPVLGLGPVRVLEPVTHKQQPEDRLRLLLDLLIIFYFYPIYPPV